jgi:hypothetical protein
MVACWRLTVRRKENPGAACNYLALPELQTNPLAFCLHSTSGAPRAWGAVRPRPSLDSICSRLLSSERILNVFCFRKSAQWSPEILVAIPTQRPMKARKPANEQYSPNWKLAGRLKRVFRRRPHGYPHLWRITRRKSSGRGRGHVLGLRFQRLQLAPALIPVKLRDFALIEIGQG